MHYCKKISIHYSIVQLKIKYIIIKMHLFAIVIINKIYASHDNFQSLNTDQSFQKVGNL